MEKHDVNQNDERTAAVRSVDLRNYPQYWADRQGLQLERPGICRMQGRELSLSHALEQFLIDYRKDYTEVCQVTAKYDANLPKSEQLKVLRNSTQTLKAAFELMLVEKNYQKLEETKMRLAFDPTADPDGTLLTRFVSNITTDKVEVATAVIGDYIRTAKRKLIGLPVENTVVPVIVGGPGIGKSRNVDRLLSPLSDYRLDLRDVSYLTDSRLYKSFGDNYVGVLDQLLPLGPTGIDTLKNFITAPVLQVRVLGTSHLTGFPNNLVLIGTSNYAIMPELLDTANRCIVYEINVDREISREISENINYTKLWQGVDENAVLGNRGKC